MGELRSRKAAVTIGGAFMALALVFAIVLYAAEADTKVEAPIVAVWCDSEGMRPSDGPHLRVAIWENGRVLFPMDPQKWGASLQEGRIAEYRIKRLKKALTDTGVFELKGSCYLVPDAPVYCTTVNVDGKKRTLYWDEVEAKNYGINIDPKPWHIEFKNCWRGLNALALVACPDNHAESKERFQKPPELWYASKAIQSE